MPLHVGLRSEESHSIQVADLICGLMKTIIRDKKNETFGIHQIPFYNKLKGKQKDAKAFYSVNEKSTQVPKTVII